MRERNLNIELLKFLAVVLVANSHMGLLYGKYSFLATGGAIGDALFFFVSGFTLFLSKSGGGDFGNWYKRRVSRIYPSVFAWALITSALNIVHRDMFEICLFGGGWFVSCIMLYYIVLFFVKKYAYQKPFVPFFGGVLLTLIWYYFEDKSTYFIYSDAYFKWCYFFIFMLTGAYVGNGAIKLTSSVRKDILFLCLSLAAFYGLFFCGSKLNNSMIMNFQIVSLLPLLGIVIFLYKLGTVSLVDRLMQTKAGLVLRAIGGLCLEAYIVQFVLFTDKMNHLFPANIIIMFVYILVVAYLTRSLGRVLLQTFRLEDYDWKTIFRIVDK